MGRGAVDVTALLKSLRGAVDANAPAARASAAAKVLVSDTLGSTRATAPFRNEPATLIGLDFSEQTSGGNQRNPHYHL